MRRCSADRGAPLSPVPRPRLPDHRRRVLRIEFVTAPRLELRDMCLCPCRPASQELVACHRVDAPAPSNVEPARAKRVSVKHAREGATHTIVTTAPDIDGHRVVEYLGIVIGEVILGANVVRDFLPAWQSLYGPTGTPEAACAWLDTPLLRRSGRYYVRARVPREFIEVLGCRCPGSSAAPAC